MGRSLTPSDISELWTQLTMEGNALFEAGEFKPALDVYERARGVALTNVTGWSDWDDALAAIVVSHLNLSEAQARLGFVSQAAHTLCTMHGSLSRTAGDDTQQAQLRDAAGRYLGETRSAMLRFQVHYGVQPHIEHLLALGCGCVHCAGKNHGWRSGRVTLH
ncbi:MAG: hypothetical protein DI603_22530 [Roseateles depolymerans]|uniref:Tetratricopeptide repeat protein n=1 Tax=Roseateles depolymerans TaxID=76731 RepID=A0A2W5FC17_9BURK|nr:MAG: hypothetical protein DI603_22530 [Roseateles depolymerans]